MNVNCDIIRDLLPLYVDDVCSASSRELVDTHLQGCAKCAEELRLMKGALPASEVIAEEVSSAKAAGKAWKKNKIRSILIGLLIAAIIGGAIYGLTVPNIVPVDEAHLQVGNVCRMESGALHVELTVTDGFKHNFIRYRTVDGAYYITPMQPLITTKEHPDFVDRKNSTNHVVSFQYDCKAVYAGWGDDAILIWEEGMELPPASPEIEAEWAFMADH